MKFKYINILVNDKNTPVIFGELIDHSYVANILGFPVTSAGFLYFDGPEKARCFGRSVTVNKRSLESDSELISSALKGEAGFTIHFYETWSSIETIFAFDEELEEVFDTLHVSINHFIGKGFCGQVNELDEISAIALSFDSDVSDDVVDQITVLYSRD